MDTTIKGNGTKREGAEEEGEKVRVYHGTETSLMSGSENNE